MMDDDDDDLFRAWQRPIRLSELHMHQFDFSEESFHTITIWLIEKVAHRNNRVVGKVQKLLPGISVIRALKDDMMLHQLHQR